MLVRGVVTGLIKNKLTLAVAESCTGGLISHRITNIPGCSGCFELGVIVYSDRSKINLLSVPAEIISKYGAVSEQTVVSMAERVRLIAKTDLGLAITGIAGPGGATSQKPVGLVYIALSDKNRANCTEYKFIGKRAEIKLKSSERAFLLLKKYLTNLAEVAE